MHPRPTPPAEPRLLHAAFPRFAPRRPPQAARDALRPGPARARPPAGEATAAGVPPR